MSAIQDCVPDVVESLKDLIDMFGLAYDRWRADISREYTEHFMEGCKPGVPSAGEVAEFQKEMAGAMDYEAGRHFCDCICRRCFFAYERDPGQNSPQEDDLVDALRIWAVRWRLAEAWIIRGALRCLRQRWIDNDLRTDFGEPFTDQHGADPWFDDRKMHRFIFDARGKLPLHAIVSAVKVPPARRKTEEERKAIQAWVESTTEEERAHSYEFRQIEGRGLEFVQVGWNPFLSSRQDYEELVRAQFEHAVARYLDQLEEVLKETGHKRTPIKRNAEHFGMTVDRRVNGLSWPELAAKWGCSESTATKAVREVEDAVGFKRSTSKRGQRAKQRKKPGQRL